MAISMDNVGAKYLAEYMDADGDFLSGDRNYKLHIPKDVPAAIFWSVTVYDPITGAGLDNGQRFPSVNTMDKPVQNADGSFDFYFGPKSPGKGKTWLATVPDKVPAASSFAALVFRPDPVAVTLRAEAVDEEEHPLGTPVPWATKLRVKADLGPVKNVLFASLIPTHYFWFTRSNGPAFVGFEGKLGNGLEVVMTAGTPATTTARVR